VIGDVYAAVKARLELNTVLSGKVNPSARLDSAGGLARSNYVIVYPTAPTVLDDDRFSKPQALDSDATFFVDVKVVAVDALGCALLADAVLTQMVGHQLALTGRVCTPAELDTSGPVRPDNTVSPPLFFSDMSFELISRRA
jgi:hypothetical protein